MKSLMGISIPSQETSFLENRRSMLRVVMRSLPMTMSYPTTSSSIVLNLEVMIFEVLNSLNVNWTSASCVVVRVPLPVEYFLTFLFLFFILQNFDKINEWEHPESRRTLKFSYLFLRFFKGHFSFFAFVIIFCIFCNRNFFVIIQFMFKMNVIQ